MFKFFFGVAYCVYEHHTDAKQSIVSLYFKNQSKGTSFAFSDSGLAIAAYHTICNGEATTKEGSYIKIIGSDKDLDIAIIQLPGHLKYKCLELGDSDTLVPGEEIYHYGFAINSLIGNKGYYCGKDHKYLYASNEMMHGQSGGPVLNSQGQVVAVCKAHLYCTPEKIKDSIYHSGPSQYIPVNTVKSLLEKYCEYINGKWVLKPIN
jgi:S1-C subfamily serine protease